MLSKDRSNLLMTYFVSIYGKVYWKISTDDSKLTNIGMPFYYLIISSVSDIETNPQQTLNDMLKVLVPYIISYHTKGMVVRKLHSSYKTVSDSSLNMMYSQWRC